MFSIRLRLAVFSLKIKSLEIYAFNAILSLLIMQKRLRTSKLVLIMDSRLAQMREQMNLKTESFIKSYFIVNETISEV